METVKRWCYEMAIDHIYSPDNDVPSGCPLSAHNVERHLNDAGLR